MSWTAILVLAGGAYLFKAVGFLVFGPAARRGTLSGPSQDGGHGADRDTIATRLGQLLPPSLLAALVVSQTVVTGTELVVDARLAGVAAGALGVWKGAPFWIVLVIAASVTAAIRLVAS